MTALLSAVTHPAKRHWLDQTINSFRNDFFDRQIVYVDVIQPFPHSEFTGEWEGWELVRMDYENRTRCLQEVVNMTDSKYVFYHEDDVLVSLPDRAHIEELFDTRVGGREVGMISLTLGGCRFNPPGDIGDLAFIEQNAVKKTDTWTAFVRREEDRSPYFFEFPGLFVRRDLLKGCIIRAQDRFRGHQIENALTKAWFDLELDKDFAKLSICKREAPEVLAANPYQVNTHCRLLSNLDPLQGSSAYGNGHIV